MVFLLVLSPTVLTTSSLPTHPTPGAGGPYSILPAFGPASTHLQHIITVVLENHDYDNLFGEYCRVLSAYCSSTGNGVPKATCIPYVVSAPWLGCVAPYNMTAKELNTTDLKHDWVSGQESYDAGAMDGFYYAEGDSIIPFGMYNGSTVPITWDLAEQYAISDNFFATNLSYSLPNHWDLVAGGHPNITYNSYVKTGADRLTYLQQANATPTIEDLLNGSSVRWDYYDYALENQTQSYNSTAWGSAYDYWNPLAGKGESYLPTESSHLVPRQQILSDLSDGSLPSLSWVIPTAPSSEHPGYNITGGETWLAQLVNAVENSPDWATTAIFVTWDDYGGWYDHVAPSTVDRDLLSFRAPIIVISPFAKENYISHTELDFFSLLHFEEWQFHLGCLTTLDCSAPMPFDFFDFNQTARLPIEFPASWASASYPMNLQTPGGPSDLCPSCVSETGPLWTYHGDPEWNPSLGD